MQVKVLFLSLHRLFTIPFVPAFPDARSDQAGGKLHELDTLAFDTGFHFLSTKVFCFLQRLCKILSLFQAGGECADISFFGDKGTIKRPFPTSIER